jgi:hypothetical protein
VTHGQRDPEIGDQRLPVVDQHVLWLDVAVDHALAVCVVQRARHALGQRDGVFDVQLLFMIQLVAERLPLDIRHHVVQERLRLAGVVQRQDMRMLQVRRHLDLRQEPLGTDHGGQLRSKHLEGHLAVVLDVMGEIHGGHPAGPELVLDHVAIDDRNLESFGDSSHQSQRSLGPGDARP